MFHVIRIKRLIISVIILAVSTAVIVSTLRSATEAVPAAANADTVRWMDFNASYTALRDAMNIDLKTQSDEYPVNWIDIIAYLACVYGNDFSKYSKKDAERFVSEINSGNTVEDIASKYKYYSYYKTTYSAVLSEFVGEYEIGTNDQKGNITAKKKYGLKVFSPIAEGYAYNHYDDFGNSRSYGFKRKHLGNDLMGSIGTPITAVEGGYVEALGWNQYGGWRIGIRSHDKKRYYYYAHLRKDHPYTQGLKEGDTVEAGTVIGYLGMTGYSQKENVNNINIPHLHFGMQIIFDESQKNGNGEIWIDVYNIVKLLSANRSTVVYNAESKEHTRKYYFKSLESTTKRGDTL